jgi:lipoate---protein ligase
MELLDLTLDTPAENLALDEALLDEAEQSEHPRECLRLWESDRPIVVVGRNSRVELEVHEDACRAAGVPVLRRTSGGCAIVAGPGCLMYALVLSYELRPELRMLDVAHRFVLETIAAGLRPLMPSVERRGTSDLALGELKFSGNSVRCRRKTILYHGTLLYDFPLELVSKYLKMPPKKPDYRGDREHESFLANLPVGGDALRQRLVLAWDATTPHGEWPRKRVEQAVAERYGQEHWNLKQSK